MFFIIVGIPVKSIWRSKWRTAKTKITNTLNNVNITRIRSSSWCCFRSRIGNHPIKRTTSFTLCKMFTTFNKITSFKISNQITQWQLTFKCLLSCGCFQYNQNKFICIASFPFYLIAFIRFIFIRFYRFEFIRNSYGNLWNTHALRSWCFTVYCIHKQ